MTTYTVKTINIEKETVIPNHTELCNRLGVNKNFDTSTFAGVIKGAYEKIKPVCIYTKVPVSFTDGDVCNLGFTSVKSLDLCKNLKGCNEAFVFAVTLGLDTERHLLTLSKTSSSRHFICDAYYSAFAEAVCDKAEEIIKGSLCCKARFSPGYGDLPLEMQRDVLNVLDSTKNAGITLTHSLLMTPQKSVTAILGITQNLL